MNDYIERGLLDIRLMSAPIDIRKYDFVSVSVKENCGALVRKDSPMAGKYFIMPHDLINTPIIFALSEFTESDICKWFLSMLKN